MIDWKALGTVVLALLLLALVVDGVSTMVSLALPLISAMPPWMSSALIWILLPLACVWLLSAESL